VDRQAAVPASSLVCLFDCLKVQVEERRTARDRGKEKTVVARSKLLGGRIGCLLRKEKKNDTQTDGQTRSETGRRFV